MIRYSVTTILLTGLIALLMGCSKEPDTAVRGQVGALQVQLSPTTSGTRASDGSIYDQTGTGYTLPFSAVNALTVELYDDLSQAPIFTHEATDEEIKTIQAAPTGGVAKLFITDIPLKTKHVKVFINQFAVANPDINKLQVTNQDTPAPAPTMGREQVPYEGITSEITLLSDATDDRLTVTATVEVAPMMSRFELHPGTIKVVDPAAEGYTFNWTTGDAGKAKIKDFTTAQISAAESSAQENFRKTHGIAASASAVYAYRVRLVRQTVTSGINNWQSSHIGFYVNYFKQLLNSTELVKNTNNGIDNWYTLANGGTAEYLQNGAHSNMYDLHSAPLASGKVIAYHLFPQSVAAGATLQQVMDAMPHIILSFTNTTTNDSRWLTFRAFRDTKDNTVITSFKPGYCYSLALADIVLTPWSLALEVRITDAGLSADSDPIIKDFDQTNNVPEPEGSALQLGLTARPWKSKDIVVEL